MTADRWAAGREHRGCKSVSIVLLVWDDVIGGDGLRGERGVGRRWSVGRVVVDSSGAGDGWIAGGASGRGGR